MVDDGVTGYVTEPQNPQAIADAIIRYFTMDDPSVFEANVRNAEKKFSWDHLVRVIEELFNG